MGSLREVRTLTRRILAFLNADPRQQLPRGTVAPLRGRDRMLLRLVPVFYHTSCVGFVQRRKTLSFYQVIAGVREFASAAMFRRWHTLAASADGACCLNPWWPLSRSGYWLG
jgi:hypothetical protein